MQNIVLIGAPGSGKTSCGKLLSEKLSLAFYDTDDLIQDKLRMSIPDIFSRHGESYFRQLETTMLEELYQAPEKILSNPRTFVLSTGGGTPIKEGNFDRLLQIGDVVLLEASLDELCRRVNNGEGRPLLSDLEDKGLAVRRRLSELLAVRNPIYRQADYKIDTSRLTPAETAQRVIDVLNLDAQG